MKTNKILRAGIVGCGKIGSEFDKDPGRKPVYTHAGAYYYDPRFSLVAGADPDKKKLAAFRRKWGAERVYTDF